MSDHRLGEFVSPKSDFLFAVLARRNGSHQRASIGTSRLSLMGRIVLDEPGFESAHARPARQEGLAPSPTPCFHTQKAHAKFMDKSAAVRVSNRRTSSTQDCMKVACTKFRRIAGPLQVNFCSTSPRPSSFKARRLLERQARPIQFGSPANVWPHLG